MKKITLVCVILIATTMFACSNINVSSEVNLPSQPLQNKQEILQVPTAFHSHIRVSDYAERLATDLVKGLANYQINSPIAIISFVEYDDTLRKTNTLGRMLSESLITEMGAFHLPIIDLHLLYGFYSDDKDEFVFSRDPNEFYHDDELNYVLSGVMIQSERGIIVNARIMEFSSQRVLSTASVLIPPYVSN
ncbi:FlgO family outer membrane protein [Thalassotalea profundi]|uniref:FlgO domain-containing protein n=1 Tax=Thalassotalea profundi TaxID=2036687 RepID=A0ABQ3J0S7_9GAMM|nr:FlgO family outer membrane protein [Thalassotalea profundi]GHF00280.1 hypothetical protein GCM10011501_32240 [Thalassotalea profundi]